MVQHTDGIVRLSKERLLYRVNVPESRAISYSVRIECLFLTDAVISFILTKKEIKKTRFVGVEFMKTIWQP